MFKKTMIYALIGAAAAQGLSAAPRQIRALGLTEIDAALGDTLGMAMTVDPRAVSLKAEEELVLRPTVSSGDSAAAMVPVVIAGRTRHIRYLRGQRSLPEGAVLLRADKDGPYRYTASLPAEGWMAESDLDIAADSRGCCGTPSGSTMAKVATFGYSYEEIRKAVERPKQRRDSVYELKGRARLDFKVNITEIDPSLRRNPRELAEIVRTIDAVRTNPEARITEIIITGYASPEGSYENNVRLSKGRAEALKQFVAAQGDLDPSIISVDYVPENWGGLRDSIATGDWAERDAILAVIDSDLEPDAKDAELKRRFPKAYARIWKDIYPTLRHSDYRVRYSLVHTTYEETEGEPEERVVEIIRHPTVTFHTDPVPAGEEDTVPAKDQ